MASAIEPTPFEVIPLEIVEHIVTKMTLLTFVDFIYINKYIYGKRKHLANFLSVDKIIIDITEDNFEEEEIVEMVIKHRLGSAILKKLCDSKLMSDSTENTISYYGATYGYLPALKLHCNEYHIKETIVYNHFEAFKFLINSSNLSGIDKLNDITQVTIQHSKSRDMVKYLFEEVKEYTELIANENEIDFVMSVIKKECLSYSIDILDYFVCKFNMTLDDFTIDNPSDFANACVSKYIEQDTISYLFEKFSLGMEYCNALLLALLSYNKGHNNSDDCSEHDCSHYYYRDYHICIIAKIRYLKTKFNLTEDNIVDYIEKIGIQNILIDILAYLIMEFGIDLNYFLVKAKDRDACDNNKCEYYSLIRKILAYDNMIYQSHIYDSGYIPTTFDSWENKYCLSTAMSLQRWDVVRYLANKLQITVDDVTKYNQEMRDKDMSVYAYCRYQVNMEYFSLLVEKNITNHELDELIYEKSWYY